MSDKKVSNHIRNSAFRECFKIIPTPTYVWKRVKDDFILIEYNHAADKLANYQMKEFLGNKASVMYKGNPEILNDLRECFNGKIIPLKEMTYKYQSLNITKNLIYSFINKINLKKL